ncbi:MAG: DUF4443 domain-containing protein [Candidatus Caldarchaeum sp.]|nr:DUF4443 domain-containing protein [Candidatus Caldarchaeum sp.]
METIRKLLSSKEMKGPLPAFTGVQLVYMILLLGSEPFVGRKKLTQLLGVGEGSVRTMLTRLSSQGYVVSTRRGITLTEAGRKVYESMRKLISPLLKVDFAMPWDAVHNYGVVVKGMAEKVSTGVDERDEAIRHGASAAMVLTCQSDGIYMPRITNLSTERPEFAQQIQSFFKPDTGDVIIVAGAPTEREAKYSALAAGLKILFGKA